jgi:hypothetical protein
MDNPEKDRVYKTQANLKKSLRTNNPSQVKLYHIYLYGGLSMEIETVEVRVDC